MELMGQEDGALFFLLSGKIVFGDVRKCGFHDRPGRETFT